MYLKFSIVNYLNSQLVVKLEVVATQGPNSERMKMPGNYEAKLAQLREQYGELADTDESIRNLFAIAERHLEDADPRD